MGARAARGATSGRRDPGRAARNARPEAQPRLHPERGDGAGARHRGERGRVHRRQRYPPETRSVCGSGSRRPRLPGFGRRRVQGSRLQLLPGHARHGHVYGRVLGCCRYVALHTHVGGRRRTPASACRVRHGQLLPGARPRAESRSVVRTRRRCGRRRQLRRGQSSDVADAARCGPGCHRTGPSDGRSVGHGDRRRPRGVQRRRWTARDRFLALDLLGGGRGPVPDRESRTAGGSLVRRPRAPGPRRDGGAGAGRHGYARHATGGRVSEPEPWPRDHRLRCRGGPCASGRRRRPTAGGGSAARHRGSRPGPGLRQPREPPDRARVLQGP